MPSEIESVRASSTWLSGSRWTEDAHAGQHSAARSNHHHRLLGRVETVLVKIFVGLQHAAAAKQDLDMFVGQVTVPRGNADSQIRFSIDPTRRVDATEPWWRSRPVARLADRRSDRRANQLFDLISIDRRLTHLMILRFAELISSLLIRWRAPQDETL